MRKIKTTKNINGFLEKNITETNVCFFVVVDLTIFGVVIFILFLVHRILPLGIIIGAMNNWEGTDLPIFISRYILD